MLTWKCHVCGRERPDALIDVYITDRTPPEMAAHDYKVSEQVRFCIDNPECIAQAPFVRFLPSPTPKST